MMEGPPETRITKCVGPGLTIRLEVRFKMSQDGIGGTKDRIARIEQRWSGPRSTVSSDFLFLASKLYKLSEQEAKGGWPGL